MLQVRGRGFRVRVSEHDSLARFGHHEELEVSEREGEQGKGGGLGGDSMYLKRFNQTHIQWVLSRDTSFVQGFAERLLGGSFIPSCDTRNS